MLDELKITIEDLFAQKLDNEHPYGPKHSCLNWFGGKYSLKERIAALSPPDACIGSYIEVFGGAGHHILYKKPVLSTTLSTKTDRGFSKRVATGFSKDLEYYADPSKNIFNDLNKGIFTVFSVIQDNDKYDRLRQMLRETPYDKEVWKSCSDWETREDDVELAWAFMVKHLQAKDATGGFAPPTEIRGKGEGQYSHKVRMFENKTGKYLDALKEKVDGMTIENYDFETCIDKYDNERAFFLLDPPYVKKTRSRGARNVYTHEMSDEDHERLVNKLLNIKGYAMLCGYDNDIYRKLEENGFKKILIKRVKRSSSNTNRDEIKDEYVWVNYPVFDGILSYFIIEEAMRDFNKLQEHIKNGLVAWDEIKYCKDIKFNKDGISATDKRIETLEKKFNINLPAGYYKFLIDFNGGYFKKEYSDKTKLKPDYFFGILEQEHFMDLGTQIELLPQLKRVGMIPIGVTQDNEFICLKVCKTTIPPIAHSEFFDSDSDGSNLVAIFRRTGQIDYVDKSFHEFFGGLYREYRGYDKPLAKTDSLYDDVKKGLIVSLYASVVVELIDNSKYQLDKLVKLLKSDKKLIELLGEDLYCKITNLVSGEYSIETCCDKVFDAIYNMELSETNFTRMQSIVDSIYDYLIDNGLFNEVEYVISVVFEYFLDLDVFDFFSELIFRSKTLKEQIYMMGEVLVNSIVRTEYLVSLIDQKRKYMKKRKSKGKIFEKIKISR